MSGSRIAICGALALGVLLVFLVNDQNRPAIFTQDIVSVKYNGKVFIGDDKIGEFEVVKKYFERQAPLRAAALKTIAENSIKYATIYNVLAPEVFCANLIRVGNVNDGGKWVCNPAAMPKKSCSIYSLGIREDTSFDTEIQAFNNNSCRIYGYDAVDQSAAIKQTFKNINGEFEKKKISTTLNEQRNEDSLGNLLKKHNDTSIEILKMDIEGSEYQTLPAFLAEFPVCQIFLEMHGKAAQMRNLLVQIARLNFYLFSYEVNGDSLTACEYSFIHSSCMDRYGAVMFSPYLNFSLPV